MQMESALGFEMMDVILYKWSALRHYRYGNSYFLETDKKIKAFYLFVG